MTHYFLLFVAIVGGAYALVFCIRLVVNAIGCLIRGCNDHTEDSLGEK